MPTPHEEIATAIVTSQMKIMGKVAVGLAGSVDGVNVTPEGTVSIDDDNPSAVDGIVQQFSSVTGPLGVRMCLEGARPVLDRHPDIFIPSFS